jgi:Subtilase family
VEWALAQKVDIISISMTFYESHSGLHQLLKKAFDDGVTVICSTADVGQLGPRVYPASWTDRTIPISACNRHFTPTELTDHGATYFLPGEHVSATSLSYVEAEKTVSGSSVATAMASGLASLILSCRNYSRLAGGHTRSIGWQRRKVVQNVFEKMLEIQTGKSVVPDRVFNEKEAVAEMAQENGAHREDSQLRRADDSTWRKWVREHFGHLMVHDVRE